MGGSSLMNNNSIFIYLGGFLAVVAIALIVFGAISKPKAQPLPRRRPLSNFAKTSVALRLAQACTIESQARRRHFSRR